ncbi:MAG: hypothetical protein WC369_00085 [Dehalococcoidales bacterium]|jgi:antitoxin component YwqK of YwqJK toxin-antitoxin module
MKEQLRNPILVIIFAGFVLGLWGLESHANQGGLYKTYYESGKLQEEGTHGGGVGPYKAPGSSCNELKNVGSYKRYYENGRLWQECNYDKDGWLDGPFKFYYENGQVGTEGTYKHGAAVGSLKEYYENGQLKSEEVF